MKSEMMIRLENHGGDTGVKSFIEEEPKPGQSAAMGGGKSVESGDEKREMFYIDENDSDGFEII